MSVSPRSIVLTLLTVGSISIGLVACTGGGGGSDPTPTPTPAFTTCELHWYGAASAAQHLNWYLVQVDPADFTSGTKNYGLTGTAPLGRLFYSFPQTATQVFASGIASAGNFTLTAATLDV